MEFEKDLLSDSFEALGLRLGATPQQVREAYRDLVQIWHPDRFSHNQKLGAKAEKKLTEINEAYELLEKYFAGQWIPPTEGRSNTHSGSRPDSPSIVTPVWDWMVIGLYCLACVGLVLFHLVNIFGRDEANQQIFYFLSLLFLMLCQAGLLFVPVRFAKGMPIRRLSIWPAIVSSGAFFGVLSLLALLALMDFFDTPDPHTTFFPLDAIVVLWFCWTSFFAWSSRCASPETFGFQIHKKLVKGSILELLIVEMAHLAVRQRKNCFAGFRSGIALFASLPLALMAFGPGIAVLYLRRVQRMRVPGHLPPAESTTSGPWYFRSEVILLVLIVAGISLLYWLR